MSKFFEDDYYDDDDDYDDYYDDDDYDDDYYDDDDYDDDDDVDHDQPATSNQQPLCGFRALLAFLISPCLTLFEEIWKLVDEVAS